jgi:hypothetical protein
MPSLFDELFSSVGFPALGNVFGEPAEYLFQNGTTQSLTDAIVNRNPPELINEKGEVYQPTFLVQVSINPNLINTGGDRIQLKEHTSDAGYKTYVVAKLLSQEGLVCSLEIR